VRFTAATPGDAREVVALHEAVAQHLQRAIPGARRWKVPQEKQIALSMKTTETILAREGELLVATFRLDPARGFCGVAPFTEADGFVYLLELAVHPSHQRRGVGRLCLDEAARWARARGSKAIRLDTNDDPIRAAAFYTACGYREVLHHAQTIYFERLL
jgi:GNAT superfamily N-acetyltransferase